MSTHRPGVETDWRTSLDRVSATLDRMAKRSEETERRLEEFALEAARRREETDRRLGEFALEAARREAKRAAEREAKRAAERERRRREDERRRQVDERRWAEADRDHAEMRRRGKEHDRRLRYLDNLFNGQWGKLMEALVDGDLVSLLKKRGISVTHTWTNLKMRVEDYRREVDILAVNGNEVVAVEVKTTMKVADVNYFLEMLPLFKKLAPEYRDCTVFGAVAYLKADENSDAYAERKGLFVIRATGSSASITNDDNFQPRAFG